MTKLLYNNSYANKLYVVPNAVMLDEKQMSDMPKVDFKKDYLNLLVVARYDFPKGFDLLLDMLKKADFDFPVKIYFIGDEKVKEIVNKYQKAGVMCIEYIGSTNQPYAWMKAADYLLLPSRWEGLPMVVLEALKLGTKVIAADTANINDLADERNVWLYKQGDVGSFTETVTHCGAQRQLPVTIDMDKYSLDYVGECLRKFYRSVIRDS
jgi:glycosyltransferase involved in cell wall biosynthesis